jgi:hypothetical protein
MRDRPQENEAMNRHRRTALQQGAGLPDCC